MKDNYSSFIEEMTKMIIRPHRDTYLLDKLGPTQLIVKAKSPHQNQKHSHKYIEVNRKDLTIQYNRQKIQLSLFTPNEFQTKKQEKTTHFIQTNRLNISPKKCVVYLHANSGSRMEGLQLVKYILPYDCSFAIFDYRGSGLSDGEYTSMGMHQSQDLQRVLQFLKQTQHYEEFSLWGRSMGAVTILYYLTKQYFFNSKQNIIIKSIVLDSPFSSMRRLMNQIGSNNINLPEFVFIPIVNSINENLQKRIGCNLIKELDLIQRIKQIKQKNKQLFITISKIDCLYLASRQDKLIHCSHAQTLYQQYPFQPKQLIFFAGHHNEIRPDSLKNKCAQFLCQTRIRPAPVENQNQEKYFLNPTRYTIANPNMRRSQVQTKKTHLASEQSTKEQPFLLQPRKISHPNSPKFQKKSVKSPFDPDGRAQRQSMKHLNNPRFQAETQPQVVPQTIIINNNYNVSVNVFDEKSAKNFILPNLIPPIQFKSEQIHGAMTDRLNDSHSYSQKYFVPHTAKLERKNQDLSGSFSNVSNSSNASINSLNMSNSSQTHTEQLQFTPSNQHQSRNIELQYSQINQTESKQYHSPQNKIEIPLINFDSIELPHHRPKLIINQQYQKRNTDIHIKSFINSPKNYQQFTNVRSQKELPEKQKLSLAELRKNQKEEQQKCSTKQSKIIFIKQRPLKGQNPFRQNIPKQIVFENEQSFKYKSQEIPEQHNQKESFKEMRSMKTSLMAKKKNDRKNSQTISINLKSSHLNKNNKEQIDTNIHQEHQIQTFFNNNNHKTLEYKYKIDHL